MRLGLGLAMRMALGVAIGACSSQQSENPPAAVEAGIGSGEAIGAACNPALAHPCEELTDVCSVSMCDPTTHICIRVSVEAGPTCGNGVPPSDDAGAPPADATVDASEAGEAGEAGAPREAGEAGEAGADAGDSAVLDASNEVSDGGNEASNDGAPDAADAGDD
jgi:hypothetical protein